MVKKSFRTKIIVPSVIFLVALVVVLNVFLSIRFSALSNFLLNEKLLANIKSLNEHLDNSMSDSEAAAVSVAHNPEVIKAIRAHDTHQLLEILLPTLDLYRINFYTICDNKGVVLARTHEPENFGDSIISQQNIKDALDGKVSTVFETGSTVKVSVRTGAPVYDTNGALIGVVSAGTRFDTDSEVEKLKKIFTSEVTIFLGDTRVATTITRDGNRITGTTLDPHIAEIVIKNKQEYKGDLEIMGEKYKTFYKPLINPAGEAFATFFLGIPEMDVIKALNKSILDGILVGLGGLVISVVLLFVIISSISKPITKLSDNMNHIANGDLRIEINTKSQDEVGDLGKSLKKVTNILHKLLDDINVMIAEQSKGNTDYCLDATDFFGDYRVLAENILELTNFSMRDQLTGLANRRSFDNRLNWEWVRASREKSAISILLLDVDKFKNYNDTFGHQQGDIALQTVAATVRQSVHRSIDFVARWGGEEFIVLLPTTDTVGALRVAETIRSAVESAVIPCSDERGHHVTVSIGVSTLASSPHRSIKHLMELVDDALYRAKETGRNKVVLGYDDDEDEQKINKGPII